MKLEGEVVTANTNNQWEGPLTTHCGSGEISVIMRLLIWLLTRCCIAVLLLQINWTLLCVIVQQRQKLKIIPNVHSFNHFRAESGVWGLESGVRSVLSWVLFDWLRPSTSSDLPDRQNFTSQSSSQWSYSLGFAYFLSPWLGRSAGWSAVG